MSWIGVCVVTTAIVTAMTMQAWSADADSEPAQSTFVPVEPCRLFDSRPGEPPLGGRKEPIGAGAANTVTQQVTGDVGECSLPTAAVAVAMNVTIVNPTAPSFLRLFPADQTTSTGSSLNWVAGQAPTPNKVDVKLSPDGKLKLFNNAGTVDVLADVVGYYQPIDVAGVESRLSALEAATAGEALGAVVQLDQDEIAEVVAVTVSAPVPGSVVVHTSAAVSDQFPGGKVFCSITTSPSLALADPAQAWESAGSDGSIGQLSGSRVFDVAAGSHTFRLMCQSATSDTQPATVSAAVMTYTFVPG
jgi:hypothetical protein